MNKNTHFSDNNMMKKKKATRVSFGGGFVSPSELPPSTLPTNKDVIGKVLLEIPKHGEKNIKKSYEVTCDEIIKMYTKVNSSLPIIQERAVLKRIKKIYENLKQQVKAGYTGKKRDCFVQDLENLFDIVKCKCDMKPCDLFDCEPNCQEKIHINCVCPKELRIPPSELIFIYSERNRVDGKSQYVIGSHDKVIESEMNKEQEKKERNLKRREREEQKAEAERNKKNISEVST